jgi:hypothetical protein
LPGVSLLLLCPSLLCVGVCVFVSGVLQAWMKWFYAFSFHSCPLLGVIRLTAFIAHTTKRKCFRWTFAFFCNLIDIALLNASIIMRIVNPSLTPGKENSFRYNFLLEVGYQLLDAHIKKRIQQRVSKQAYTAMEFLGYKRDFKPQIETYGERRLMGRCTTCSRKNDKKTTQKCSSCHSFVCNEHATKFVKCNTCEH